MTTPALLQPKQVYLRITSALVARRGGIDQVRRGGGALLCLQLIGLIVWGFVRADRFALTFDFSAYYQAWWLIAHGHLSAYDSALRFPFWQNHGEFLMWPLGLLGLISSSPAMLLVIQSVALVAVEWVCFAWLCDVIDGAYQEYGQNEGAKLGILVSGAGLVLLIASPWIYWSDSFDFHFEIIGILFVVLAGRDLYHNPHRRRLWLWVALALLSGDVVATYIAALGLTAMVAGRRWRTTGLALVVGGVAWVAILSAIGANRGSNLVHNYGYLAVALGVAEPAQLSAIGIVKGIAEHPGHLLSVLWRRRLDVYAVVMPGGVLGLLSPWALVGAVLVLIESGLNRNSGFIAPSFQDLLLFVLLPIGTAQVLMVIGRRSRRWAAALAIALAVNAVGWGVVWIPQVGPRWLRVSPAAASALSSVLRHLPSGDEVVVSQGVAGDFAGRQWLYDYSGAFRVPIHTKTVWIIVTPNQGIELASTSQADALIEELAGPLHARLVLHRAGVWAFRWTPKRGVHSLTIPASYPTIASWTSPGGAGTSSRGGPEANWRAVADGHRGYVVSGDYWSVPPGRYDATVILSSTVPVNVEVWNATGNALLFRRSVPPTNAQVAVDGVVNAYHRYKPAPLYGGVGLFRVVPTSPTPDNRLEIRVWSPGGGLVSVASLELQHEGAAGG